MTDWTAAPAGSLVASRGSAALERVQLINHTRKIGPTTYSTSIRDNPERHVLEITVNERTWGMAHSFEATWPYEDKSSLMRQLEDFCSRKPEPIKGEWFARIVARLIRRPLIGHLGLIAVIADRRRRLDAFVARSGSERVFFMKDGPDGWKGDQETIWISFPFCHLEDIRERIATSLSPG